MSSAADDFNNELDDTGDSSMVSGNASASNLPRWLGKRVGRFRIIAMLGQGAWGRVFEAEDTQLRRRVALKCINTNSKARGVVPLERLLTEARAAAAIEHPNVTQVYEVGETKGIFYIAMELAEGGSTHDLIKTNGPLDIVRACQLCAEAADALQAGHELGIIHRDIKPANLLLGRNGRCKVADFGLAHGGDVSDPLHASKQGGTPFYIAPEIVRGSEGDARADIYSLGATLVYLLTGRHIVTGEKRADVLRAQLDQTPLDVRSVRPEIDRGLADVIRKSLSKDPGERFQSARDMGRALRVYTVPVGTTTAAPSAGTSGNDLLRKYGPIGAFAAIVCGLLVVMIPLLGSLGDDDDQPADQNPVTQNLPANPSPPPVIPPAPANTSATVRHTFTLDVSAWNDKPNSVHVAGDFNEWNATTTPLTDPNGDDKWSVIVPLAPDTYHYKFVIDNDRWISDPASDPGLDEADNYGGVNSGVKVGGSE